MTHEPQIKSLSKRRRSLLFGFLVLVFLLALPAMIFYTTGYRLNFSNEQNTIVTTGGLYINTNDLEVDVYVDEELVEKPRLFRSAYYIQDVEAGKHRVVVQRPDLQTWVKELTVDSRIVVEASAFNMPMIPHLRPITEYVTTDDMPVYPGVASSSELFIDATSTVPFVATSSLRIRAYELNEEFVYVDSLFSSSSTSTLSVFERFMEGVGRFGFATTSNSLLATTSEEEVIERGNIQLVQKKRDIYAVWTDEVKDIPYYFCVSRETSSTTAERYGQHVADAFADLKDSTTTPIMLEDDRMCRPEIKLNRLRQDVYFYDFFPNTRDLVIMKLEDGLYVTEIDDRAWQNTQIIYPGKDFRVVVENGIIYIQDGDYYYELVTEVEEN